MNLEDPRGPRKANDAWWKRHYSDKRKAARRDRMQALTPYLTLVSVSTSLVTLIVVLAGWRS